MEKKRRTTALSRKAGEDVLEIALHISSGSVRAAEAFREALEHAYSVLEEMPEIGALRSFDNPRLADLRMWPVRKFEKYLLLYRVLGNTVHIVRVLHGARDIQALFSEPED